MSIRKKDIDQIIISVAGNEFAEKGFEGARVDEIAELAGVNKASLYYHIGDKAALYAAVFQEAFGQVTARLESIQQEKGSARERLEKALTEIVTRAVATAYLPRIMLRVIAGGGSNLGESELKLIGRAFLVIRTLLTEGAARGEFRAVNPLTTHFQVVGAAILLVASRPLRDRVGTATGIAEYLEPPPPDVLARSVLDLMLNGLLATPAEVRQ